MTAGRHGAEQSLRQRPLKVVVVEDMGCRWGVSVVEYRAERSPRQQPLRVKLTQNNRVQVRSEDGRGQG